ncbi:MAG: lysophospholipid acyltransferase family protein, partial [Gammaproteobacteria bacterium]|nr:lysophospholipid acyltransferase family protein [Gammaproteobacteria bacterium]
MVTVVRNSLQLRDPAHAGLGALWRSALDQLLGLRTLDQLYRSLPPGLDAPGLLDAAADALALDCDLLGADLDSLPADGPLVIVCNHPFGGADGILLTRLLLRRRPDLKVLANSELARLSELAELLLPLNIFGAARSSARNRRSLRAAARWLGHGGAVLLFPAGEVAHMSIDGRVNDRRWSAAAGWLVRRARATVVPACFEGRNPWWFQVAGGVHPLLRSALLPRVLLSQAGQRFRLHLGARIPYGRLDKLACEQSISDVLRALTLNLSTQVPAAAGAADDTTRWRPAPLATAVAPELLQAEIAALPAQGLLLKNRSLQVHLVRASEIPWTLREIGRLRELTFRRVGEGTGRPLDLDRFDEDYRHLFIWDASARRVVGAYRLGPVDDILTLRGRDGLYTHSLFRYSAALLQDIGPAVELGRSFIIPEYQRSFAPLLLLWRGIGAFMAQHPHYRCLFGPVSISADYPPEARRCLVRYLRRHAYNRRLARRVRPRRAYRSWPLPGNHEHLWREVRSVSDVDLFSNLLSAGDREGRGVPVLLRHYLKLGGRIIGFNVDRE